MNFGIIDTETCIPDTFLSYESILDMSSVPKEEIKKRFHLHSKPIANETEDIFELGFTAATKLVDRNESVKNQIKLVIACSAYPDKKIAWYPSAVAIKRLSLPSAFGFDIHHGCNSLLAAIELAKNWLSGLDHNACALVITSDRLSEMVDYNDENHLCFFGFSDGGSAVLLSNNNPKLKLLSSSFSTQADLSESQFIPRYEKKMWVKDSKEEDEILIQTYRQEYMNHITQVLCNLNPSLFYQLIMNQGDHKLINYLSHELPLKPKNIFKSYLEYGHAGNTDIALGFKDFLTSTDNVNYLVAASSSIGYSFSAMLFEKTK